MKGRDIARLAWHNLWQRKLSTLLNLVGITVGAAVLLLAIAGLNGVEAAFRTIFESSEFAREIEIRPSLVASTKLPDKYQAIISELPEDRRESITKLLSKAWNFAQRRKTKFQLTAQDLENCEQLSGALRVVPEIFSLCEIDQAATWMRPRTELDWLNQRMYVGSLDVGQRASQNQVLSGALPDESNRRDSVAISEILAYRLGYVTREDLRSLIGKKIDVGYLPARFSQPLSPMVFTGSDSISDSERKLLLAVFKKVASSGVELTARERTFLAGIQTMLSPADSRPPARPKFLKRKTFRIASVVKFEERVASVSQMFRRFNIPRDADIMIHYETLYEMWVDGDRANEVRSAKLVVDSTQQLESMEKQIQQLDLHSNSALWAWRRIKEQIDAAGIVIQVIGITILLTSAFGISNTLLASVIQRTSEFGILKSLGMRDRDLGFQVVCESVVLALIGSLLALVLAYLMAYFGHQYVSDYIQRRAGEPLNGQLIQFTPYSIFLAFLITTAICVVASLYPAWRAARLDPIEAMRQE